MFANLVDRIKCLSINKSYFNNAIIIRHVAHIKRSSSFPPQIKWHRLLNSKTINVAILWLKRQQHHHLATKTVTRTVHANATTTFWITASFYRGYLWEKLGHGPAPSKGSIQGSHRNPIIKFHDFSMTIYAVFHDGRKANTEDHRVYSSHIRKESKISFQTENKESKRWFASSLR